jgi:hypothetical protein
MRSGTLFLVLFLSASSVAFADESPAMQLAKRVATMENSRDLPSRAVWLSNRVIQNSRGLAYVRTRASKKKSRSQSIKN